MSVVKREEVTRAAKKHTSKKTRSCLTAAYGAAAVALVLGALLFSFQFPLSKNTSKTIAGVRDKTRIQTMSTGGAPQPSMSASIVEGETHTTPPIPYYLCGNPTDPHIVLLHGARFTKADWEQSGILQQFCKEGNLSVSALNLSVRADHTKLLQVIESLASDGKVTSPIAAVVTPSASGFTIIDGITNDRIDTLRRSIRSWIPVASPASLQHDVSVLSKAKGWPILAVYGDKDAMGKKASYVWKDAADAQVVELKVSCDACTPRQAGMKLPDIS